MKTISRFCKIKKKVFLMIDCGGLRYFRSVYENSAQATRSDLFIWTSNTDRDSVRAKVEELKLEYPEYEVCARQIAD